MIRRPPRSTQSRSSAASDVYTRQIVFQRDLALAIRAQIVKDILLPDFLLPHGEPARQFIRQRHILGRLVRGVAIHDTLVPSATCVDTLGNVWRLAANGVDDRTGLGLSLIHISEPTRLGMMS